MFKKILVPLDGSELAEVVFTHAKELAGRLDIDIILLYVSAPARSEFAPMRQAYIERAANIIRRETREVQRKTGGGERIRVQGELAEGYPAEEILSYAEKNAVDLILIAAHGHSGVKRWTLGNVADKVLRASTIPVWLVHAGMPDETPYDQWPRITIIATLDGSELAESVLPHVETLAKQRSDKPIEVVLLRVCEPPAMPTYYGPEFSGVPLNWGQYEQQEIARGKQVAKEYLATLEKRLKDSNLRSVRSEVLVGRAADEIVDYASKNPFNMIVMATHGRAGLSRWVYGSTAENVLQGVSSPILLVKPRQSDSSAKKGE